MTDQTARRTTHLMVGQAMYGVARKATRPMVGRTVRLIAWETAWTATLQTMRVTV
jgi:hypothetical protein